MRSFQEAQAEADAPVVLRLGGAAGEALAAVKAVQSKVGDYFTRCRLAACDATPAGPLNPVEAHDLPLGKMELSAGHSELAGLPIAKVAPGAPLPHQEGLNPAWSEAASACSVKSSSR